MQKHDGIALLGHESVWSDKMETVRLGIVGIGGIGSAHFNCVVGEKIRGMSLGAVCDIDPARLEYCKSISPEIPCFEDYKNMLKSGLVDAVLIAVPHRLHAKIAIDSLESGLHVLTEKPVDITVSAARKLNETAKRSDRVFGIMFNQRTNPIFKKAREIVQSGQLGNLKRSVWIITNWYRTQHYYDSGNWRATWSGEGGGVLINQAPHNLDLWQWICGMPSEITAFCETGKWHDIEVEDDVGIFAKYPNGATGVFITSTGDLPGTNRLEISGTKGSIVIEQGRLVFKKLRSDEREICVNCKESWPSPELDIEIYEPNDVGTAHSGILQNFADAILKGEQLLAPGEDGINELLISNAAYLSQWTGQSVKLPFEEELFDRFLREKQENSMLKSVGGKQTYDCYSERWQVRF